MGSNKMSVMNKEGLIFTFNKSKALELIRQGWKEVDKSDNLEYKPVGVMRQILHKANIRRRKIND